ncbi:MAG: hypothetical protein CMJ83_16220 [Planctomycetes bacterium]|nr:hypothetical protein [Planctomycetota bacterium]
MPCEFTIYRDLRLVLSLAWGTVTDEDVLTHLQGLGSAFDFDSGFSQFVDLSAVQRLEVTPEGIRSLVERIPFGPGSRRAYFAPSDVAFGMTRMHQMLLDEHPVEIGVFRTSGEALDWLGISGLRAGSLSV